MGLGDPKYTVSWLREDSWVSTAIERLVDTRVRVRVRRIWGVKESF